MRRALLPFVVGLLCVAAWWWWPSEEGRIRAVLERMAAAVGASDEESDLARMARVASLAHTLTPAVTITVGARRLEGRDAVLAAARAMAASRGARAVDLEEVDVALAPGHTSADARVVVRVDDTDHELRVALVQGHDGWLVDRVDAEAPLRRPGAVSPP